MVDALKVWGNTDKDVAYRGCGAIWNLANKNDTNKKKFQKLGAMEVVKNVSENSNKQGAIRY